MESRQLHYYRTVVEHGSFTEAASALHMTQPSLSLVVRRLEEEFGVTLLVRSRQGVRTTEAGAYLYATAVRVLEQMHSATEHLRSLAVGHAGRIVLSSAPIFNWEYLPRILSALRRQAPGLELAIQDPPPDQTVTAVIEGQADIGIVAGANLELLQQMHGDRLAMQVAMELPLKAVLPPGYASTSPRVSLAELRHESWLVPVANAKFPGLPELLEQFWRDHPATRPDTIQETATLQTALPLVAGGMGVALMPGTVRHMAQRSVIVREISETIPPLLAIVLWRKGEDSSPAVQRVVHLLTHPDLWDNTPR
ncbi:LysR family transcriptional regulator [Kocuria dechangensis]|uniref:LysR family transcriptional regulator n=1 Tax=Kocuria dechangensis TaxID=1176249 RepID=A0A917LVQ8_9MICC|nr:LysR family transcriptional regulator [Kocuria dechangensis]GGG61464.1 LysR family transcriptional regulator [Kocuria dechangensis]